MDAMPSRARITPSALPARPSSTDLQDVGGQDLTCRGADAFEDRHALDLLAHEDARHAPDANPAKRQDHEADQAQVVFGAKQIVADLILGRSIRPHVHELVTELLAKIAHERLRIAGHPEKDLVVRAAAEREQARAHQIVVVDEHARSEAERARRAAPAPAKSRLES